MVLKPASCNFLISFADIPAYSKTEIETDYKLSSVYDSSSFSSIIYFF